MEINPYKNKFEVVIRAVVENKGKILLCRSKKGGHYFLPGGHLEFGEKIKEALTREFKEELNMKLVKLSFIGIVDNIFTQDNEKRHEINLVFNTKVNGIKTKSREGHIDFALIDKKEFDKTKIYPIALKKQLIKWFKNKEKFWVSQF